MHLPLTFTIACEHPIRLPSGKVEHGAEAPMLFKDKKTPPSPNQNVTPSSTPPPDDDDQGPSSLLLNEGMGGRAFSFEEEAATFPAGRTPAISPPGGPMESTEKDEEEMRIVHLDELPPESPPPADAMAVPLDKEAEIPSVVQPPRVSMSKKPSDVAGDEEEELRVILLDEAAAELPPDVETPAAHKRPSAVPTPAHSEATSAEEELRVILLDDVTTSETPTSAGKPVSRPVAPKSPAEISATGVRDDSDVSALLIESELPAASEPVRLEDFPSSPLDAELPSDASMITGSSSLLLDTEPTARPIAPEEPPAESKRGWRHRRERVRIIPPKEGAPVEWFSNADACAAYCRKHHRPLLLYFTTGNMEQCRTYEEAIRREEMRLFLSSYVCCMVNLAQTEGRKVAMRLGVPTDGPAIVVLSPSGREYARVLKSEVDWRFLATMLFWGLR